MTKKASTPTAENPTTGEAPILGDTPVVTIAGREYKLRRLGVRDTFALARIISAGARASGMTMSDNPSAEELVGLLASGLGAAEEQAIALLASLIGVTPAAFSDPDLFPMGSELEIIAALAQHQDLRAFFTRLGTLMRSVPELQTRTA